MELSINDLKEFLCGNAKTDHSTTIGNDLIGKHVIIRTYSAGVHFGELTEKQGSEVILANARRLYYWKTNGGISLSEVANTGLHNRSKVCAAVDTIWLDAIEIIPCTSKATTSIREISDYVSK